jgi:hypothetical protein
MENVLHWAEEHPYWAGGITLGLVFLLLWLFGFFGSSSSSSSSGQSNLAAAYYAAEAAQTTAATQLQMATVAYGNQTAQVGLQANAAEAIAQTQANAATTINGQNTGAAMTINQQNASLGQTVSNNQVSIAAWAAQTAIAQSSDQLQAAINSQNDAASTAAAQAQYGYLTTQAGYNAQIAQTLAAGTIAAEQAGRGLNLGIWTPGGQISSTGSTVGGPIDASTLAQLSPAERASLGLA